VSSRTGVAKRLSEDLLAHTGLAEQQHRAARQRDEMQLREHGTNRLALVDDGAIGLKGGHLAASDDAVIGRPVTRPRLNKVVPVTRSRAGGSVTIERPRGVIRVGKAIGEA
jgi:hypothetical protein